MPAVIDICPPVPAVRRLDGVSLPERVTAGWVYGVALLAGLAGFTARPADPIVIAAVLALVALVMAARCLGLAPPTGVAGVRAPGAALRERVRLRGVPRLCDPDARGRRRPRAPTAHPSAA